MPTPEEITVIDGHVHVRDCFEPSGFLSAALANLDRLGAQTGAADVHGVLMLAEQSGEESFGRWAGHDRPLGRWRFDATDEACVLAAERDDGRTLTIVNGRQWTCDDKLEVLTLGSDARLDDGLDVERCIDDGLAAGAMVVLPWGFGKWTGARRERLLGLVASRGDAIVLGDSAARPVGLSDPVLDAGRRAGLAVLPGTDPLPLNSHASRAGRYALSVPGCPPRNGRWDWLRSQIVSSRDASATIGRRDGVVSALLTQIRLRVGGGK